ncbi:MAG: hypothetical protein IJB96_12225 [Lachnospira sp.]|nr:hypothetical protein [Lachnospira sp.]
MKFKRILSAITALAMSVSAFAGLATTASAAEATRVNFIGSEAAAETFDSYDGANWTSTAASFSTAASGNAHFGIVTVEEIEKPEIGESITVTTTDETTGETTTVDNYPTYVSGSVLDTQVRGKTEATTTYSFPSVVANGKLYFETDLYSHSNPSTTPNGAKVNFLDSEGNVVAYAEIDTSAYLRIYDASAKQLDRTDLFNLRGGNYAGLHFGVEIDLDADTILFSADYIDTSKVRTTTVNKGIARDLAVDNIAAMTITYKGHGSSNNFGWAIDNTKLYADVYPESAVVTVNYVDSQGTVLNTITDEGGNYVGDKYTYYYPAYYEKDGVYYKANTTDSYVYGADEETGQTIISGMGELHLEIIIDRLKREHNVEANTGAPQVAYRETIRGTAEAQGKHIKQSGGRGQYGDVWIKFEPNEAGKGFEFIDQIKGGVVPQEYRKPVQKGVEDTLAGGVIAGYPVVDVKATLYDGSYHDVDSSELAFTLAGALATREGIKKANPVLLEPIMKMEITTPEEFMGDVIGDINARRGRVDEMEDLNGGAKLIKAFCPLANLFGYTGDLRGMTQGRAASSMELFSYEEVPPNVAQEIIEKRNSK